tara:strand:+ start:294 stop:689 length:396 start_codon:yes stop_codon:yes gene_type:complete
LKLKQYKPSKITFNINGVAQVVTLPKPNLERVKTMTNSNEYNGWTNKETWLVNVWYMDSMPEYFAEMEQYHVEANELEEAVTYICEESEALSSLPVGLLSDFIRDCWSVVDWHSLADHLNVNLKSMEEEAA